MPKPPKKLLIEQFHSKHLKEKLSIKIPQSNKISNSNALICNQITFSKSKSVPINPASNFPRQYLPKPRKMGNP